MTHGIRYAASANKRTETKPHPFANFIQIRPFREATFESEAFSIVKDFIYCWNIKATHISNYDVLHIQIKFLVKSLYLHIIANLLAIRKEDYSFFCVYTNTFLPQAID